MLNPKNAVLDSGVNRIVTIDSIRGLAILLMIYANFTPYMLGDDPPFVYRLLSSLAAPLFIFTAGYSSFLGTSKKPRKITGSLLILVTAALIDMLIWGILPFQTFDVLYTISISLFLICLLPLKSRGWLAVSIGVFALSIVARSIFDYRFLMGENFMSDGFVNGLQHFKANDSMQRLLVDGWFPLLPWLGFAFLGRYASEKHVLNTVHSHVFKWILSLVFTGACIITYKSPLQPLRDGYVELFYPPALPYLLIATSWIGIVFTWVSFREKNPFLTFCSVLGRRSLFIYLIHSAIVHFILDRLQLDLDMALFLLSTSFIVLGIYGVAHLMNRIEDQGWFRQIPWAFRKVFGL
jgi:uncharacterized membrane protein